LIDKRVALGQRRAANERRIDNGTN
jgi:hypothetical protein